EDELTAPIAILKETAEGIWATTCLSRGCPKGCRFCSNHLCHGQEFRTVRMDALRKALMNLPANKLLHLNFEDDNLLCVPDYFFEVLRMVKSIHPSARFSAENGLDYLLLDAITIGRLIQYGFRRFNLSLGTIYPETALRVDRPINLSHYREVIREIHTRGASSITYFIAGLEGDTPERIVQQIQFLQSLPTLIGISLFYPVPGIPDFSPPPELLRKHPGLGRGSFAYPWTGTLTTEELVTAFRLCRYVNLLKKEQKTQEEEVLIQRIQEKGHLLTFLKQPSNQQQLEGLEYRRSNNLIMGEVPINQTMVKLFFS
ncbi:MAG: radical SAM protein, partial [Spirochaetes bacterium]|nr:radical SAM protein [Spirochaetota bacterium]